ncbi:MAG: ice-binding family protein [Patescibacteria group bacterium]
MAILVLARVSVTGFPPGTLNGTEYVADATAVQAQVDLVTAYTNAAGQTPVSTVPTELGGTTLTAGIYDSSAGTFGVTGTLTLDAEGDPDAVFIFQTDSTLITAGASNVSLLNGAQACNVFWKVGSSATLGTDSTFKGNILALTSATLTTGADVEGRVLARNGAVTLDTNTITKAVCVAPPELPTPPTTPAVPPLINVTKVPDPLALPDGAGAVIYTYTVTNVGTVAMSNIAVTDDKCDTVEYVSGDTNSDDMLDLDEAWLYSCTRTVSKTVTNTVTATGEANGYTAIDTANATVVVGVALPPPLITLVKTPDSTTIPESGDVTYTYTVTNPGTVALTDVSVVDDKCSPVTYVSGDDNDSGTLNVLETWIYTCTTNLTDTTTNTGTAQGSANGITIIDYSVVTVVNLPVEEDTTPIETPVEDTTEDTTEDTSTPVDTTTDTTTTVPGLPDTGVAPYDQNIFWIISESVSKVIIFLFE